MKDIWESLPTEVTRSFSKKYIYDVSFESLSVFLMALNENIYIEAFVLCSDRESVMAMNKKIIHIEEIPNEAQLLIPEVLRKNVDKYKLQKNIEKIDVKVHTIAEKILRSSVYIFGAGEHGKATLERLSDSGVSVKGFIDSDKEKQGGGM